MSKVRANEHSSDRIRIKRLKPQPKAHIRLFCFPYAGGGLSVYTPWVEHFEDEIELCAIELAGRDGLISKAPFLNLNHLIENLLVEMEPYLDLPYVLFGHSMGSLISFELTRALRTAKRSMPILVFLSAHRAAHLPDRRCKVHCLNDKEFIDALSDLQGTPQEVLDNDELMALVLPTLRADFTLSEMYQYCHQSPLEVPLSVFGGMHDSEVSFDELNAWSNHTDAGFTLRMFPGNHFFLHTHGADLIRIIQSDLNRLIREQKLRAHCLEVKV